MSPLTIVLPTRDRRHVLERTIDHYRSLAERWPLLVVDDGSRDGTAEWLAGLGVAVLRTPRRGLPSARNTGLQAARTPWVLFGEDDVLFGPGHVEALLAAAGRLPRCAAVAGRLFSGTDWRLPEQCPAASSGPLIDGTALRLDTAARLDRPVILPSLHACALVDRAAVLAAGGYDPAFTGSHFREESDLYARLWRSGRACWLVPDAWAIHVSHRLGGGCRGRRGLGAMILNRLSYLGNDARFAARHLRLWRRWKAGPDPGGHTAGAAWRLLRNLWRQVRGA